MTRGLWLGFISVENVALHPNPAAARVTRRPLWSSTGFCLELSSGGDRDPLKGPNHSTTRIAAAFPPSPGFSVFFPLSVFFVFCVSQSVCLAHIPTPRQPSTRPPSCNEPLALGQLCDLLAAHLGRDPEGPFLALYPFNHRTG